MSAPTVVVRSPLAAPGAPAPPPNDVLDALHKKMRAYTVALTQRRGSHMHDYALRKHAQRGRGFVLQTLDVLDVELAATATPARFKLRYATVPDLAKLDIVAPEGALRQLAEYDPELAFVMLQQLMVPVVHDASGAVTHYSPMYVPARIGDFDSMLECGAAGCEMALPLNARGIKMKCCARCKVVSYCSKECQLRDWTARHRHECAVETT